MVILTDVKTYLGIDGSEYDIRLQSILDSINDIVKDSCGDLAFGEKSVNIYYKNIKNNTITLPIIQPTKINSINDINTTSLISGIDYFIKDDGNVIIKDLLNYEQTFFGYYNIKYNAGFEEVPPRLIKIVSDYVGYLFSQDLGKTIQSEQTGPRNVSYSSEKEALIGFKKGLGSFIPLALKIF